MKTSLLYGLMLALVGALLTYGLFFAGYHDTPEKVQSTQWIGMVIGPLAAIACFSLAMRERRAEFPVNERWSYGSALGVGVLTALWSAIFGAISAYIYFAIVDSQFSDMIYQMQVNKLEAMGRSPSQIEAAGAIMRRFTSPLALTVSQAFGGFIIGVLVSLVVAIFFRERAEVESPAESMAPPPLV